MYDPTLLSPLNKHISIKYIELWERDIFLCVLPQKKNNGEFDDVLKVRLPINVGGGI